MKLDRAVSLATTVLLLLALESPAQQRRPPRAGSVPAPSASQGPSGNVEHGRYIVEKVVMCVQCHSPRDEQGTIIAGQEYTGGPIPFRPPWPNDWADRAPRNRGLTGYTRELGIRLFTMGAIDREDRQLRPPMPPFHLTAQDAADVVAYMTSLR